MKKNNVLALVKKTTTKFNRAMNARIPESTAILLVISGCVLAFCVGYTSFSSAKSTKALHTSVINVEFERLDRQLKNGFAEMSTRWASRWLEHKSSKPSNAFLIIKCSYCK